MTKIYLNSTDEATKYYQNISFNDQVNPKIKEYNNKKYTYYGKTEVSNEILKIYVLNQINNNNSITENKTNTLYPYSEYPNYTKLDFEFKTQVTDLEGTPIKICICDSHKSREGYPIYELKSDVGEILGDISLAPQNDHIYVHLMYGSLNGIKPYKNVGRALHEFAIRESFRHNLNGRVTLGVAWRSDIFHYLCGFRYDQNLVLTLPLMDSKLKNLIFNYYKAKKKEEPTANILTQIQALIEDVHIKIQFKALRKYAKKTLKREPTDLKEILDNGVYFDKNNILAKTLAKDPMHHNKVAPLFKAYQKAKENNELKQEIIQQVENLQNDTDKSVTEIFKGLRKIGNVKYKRAPTTEEIINCGLEKKNYIDFGGSMFLSNEKIEEWKLILKIQ